MTFTSDRYGYSIRHPPGWVVRSPGKASRSDEFYAPPPSRTRLSIVRRDKPGDMPLKEIAEEVYPHRAEPDGCHWNSAGIIAIPASYGRFEEMQIGGRPALVRSEGSWVEAMIDDGDDVVLVVLRSGSRLPTGDRWNFDRFMETLYIDPRPTAASEEPVPSASDEDWSRFRSTHYGYAIRYPREWLVKHTEIGRHDVFADDLSSPTSFSSKLLIVRRTIPDGTSIWDAARGWFGRGGVINRKCGNRLPFFGRMYQLAPFVETTIAGSPALIRSECSEVHAIVDLGGQALLLTLRSRKSMATGDDALFRRLVETLEIDPATQ